jgi:hypothetical protein
MKVELTEGCIVDSLDIDGFPFHNIHENALNGITESLLRFLRRKCQEDSTFLQDLLIQTTSRFGDSEYVSHCEECGDDVYKTTLDLKLARRPYQRGVKDWLGSFEVGEVREYDRRFAWGSIISGCTRLKKDFGCVFKVCWKEKTITRLV